MKIKVERSEQDFHECTLTIRLSSFEEAQKLYNLFNYRPIVRETIGYDAGKKLRAELEKQSGCSLYDYSAFKYFKSSILDLYA